MAEGFCSIQLIEGDGEFNKSRLENFVKAVRLVECGLSYAVVSIMGPQSSGKSTLLNHLFETNFREMDALKGRFQTTKGIWMARCAKIVPCTIVMDLEGTDGSERGEDDTAFERQSALFALAVSDIVLINMWCHDIGREQAASKPLLKTVFQVMMQLFSPRKTTLMFVIRDITKTPLEKLDPVLREDIQKIWDSVHKETPLSEFFNVEVVALPSYEEKEEQFKEKVASLRQRFFHSIAPGGLAGDRRAVVAASGFALSVEEIWKVIKENKYLDHPAHKVMVATVHCKKIANAMFAYLTDDDEEWRQLKAAAEIGIVPGFGQKLSSILEKCLSRYDREVTFYDEGVRTAKRQKLKSKLVQLVHPAYLSVLGHLRSKTLDAFKNALAERSVGFADAARDFPELFMSKFDEGCEDAAIEQAKWDSSKIREELQRDVLLHIKSEAKKNVKKKVLQAAATIVGIGASSLFGVIGLGAMAMGTVGAFAAGALSGLGALSAGAVAADAVEAVEKVNAAVEGDTVGAIAAGALSGLGALSADAVAANAVEAIAAGALSGLGALSADAVAANAVEAVEKVMAAVEGVSKSADQ